MHTMVSRSAKRKVLSVLESQLEVVGFEVMAEVVTDKQTILMDW